MNRPTLTGPIERLDVTGIEIGRLLILGTTFDNTKSRAYRYRVDVECSCGFIRYNVALKDVMSGKTSRCVKCAGEFRERYGSNPPREKVTANDIYQAVAIRDTERAEEAEQYARARATLGL